MLSGESRFGIGQLFATLRRLAVLRPIQRGCLVFIFVFLYVISPGILSPTSAMQTSGQVRIYTGSFDPDSPLNDPAFLARRRHLLNIQRQKEMVSDSEKLLSLSQLFHDQITKNPSPELSPLQLQQLTRIEKLAHSVREKMVDIEGEPEPGVHIPFPPQSPWGHPGI